MPCVRQSRSRPPLGAKPAAIRNYSDLTTALAHRRNELNLTQFALDQVAGTQDGYVGKLEAGVRSYGPLSLGLVLQALGVELVLRPRSENERVDA